MGAWFVKALLEGEIHLSHLLEGVIHLNHLQWGCYIMFFTVWHWPEGVPLISFPPCLGEVYSSRHLCGARRTLLGEAIGLHPDLILILCNIFRSIEYCESELGLCFCCQDNR